MKHNSRLIVLVLAMGLGLSLALLWLLAGRLPAARANLPLPPLPLYVATDGDDAHNCTSVDDRCRTVQRAVDVAATGAEIRVASGVYTDADTAAVGCVVTLTKSVTLRGGYDSSFADPPDPTANPTTLDARRQGRVISITGDITPTIKGFIITGGDATGLGGAVSEGGDGGGGIACYQAHPVIADNVITGNVAGSSKASGGGIYLEQCYRAVVSGNTIISNTASSGGSGHGGGASLIYNDGATVSGNTVMSNAAGVGGGGQGGGLYLYDSDATLSGNTVQGNVGSMSGWSGKAGGIFIEYGIVTVSGNTVRGNAALRPNLGLGGGLYILYGTAVTLDGNRITDNAADTGGGILVEQGSTFTLTNNVIAGNQAQSFGDGLGVRDYAGSPSTGILLHNTIADNAGLSGEGVCVWGDSVALTLTNNIIAGHTVGITNVNPVSLTVTADHTLFHGNTTKYGSGVNSTGEVSGNPLFANPAALDYHIGPGSPAIDAGIPILWLAHDIDGDQRPMEACYDIGADEAWWRYIYLPLVLKN